jgi:hypothetical protein
MINVRRLQAAIGAAVLAGTFSLLTVNPAQAQSGRLTATIPFGFYAGDTLLPAGDYKIEKLESGVVRLSNRDTHESAMFHTMAMANAVREALSGELIFNRYGQQHFLTELWWPGQGNGRKTLPSKAERELAQAQTRVRIAADER